MDFHPVQSVKAHPYLFGGVLIGGFLFIFMLRRGSSGEAVTSGQPSNATDNTMAIAQLNAQTSLAGTQIAAQAQAEQIQAQKEVALAQLDTVTTHDNINATVRLSEIAQGANLSAQEISASREVSLATLGSQERVAVLGIQNQMHTTDAFSEALRALAARTQ